MTILSRLASLSVYILCGTIFSLFFVSCSDPYREYYNHEYRGETLFQDETSLETVDGIYVTPDMGVMSGVIESFGRAKKRIYLTVYLLTESHIVDALIDAHKRGVDVRVILEQNVYGTPTINTKTFQRLTKAGVQTVYADNNRYTFTHAKYWIVDDVYFVSTGNFSYSSFHDNRDVIISGKDIYILQTLETLFQRDFSHEGYNDILSASGNIGISPMNMREFLESHISRAKQKIILYVQDFSDVQIASLLDKKRRSGVMVYICAARKADSSSDNSLFSGVVLSAKKPYLHAKVILIDTGSIIVGSTNLTENALNKNREVMLAFSSGVAFQSLYQYIHTDCKD